VRNLPTPFACPRCAVAEDFARKGKWTRKRKLHTVAGTVELVLACRVPGLRASVRPAAAHARVVGKAAHRPAHRGIWLICPPRSASPAAEHDPRSDRLDLRCEPAVYLGHDRVLRAAHRDGAGRVRARPADTLPERVSCIDGTLLPCWSYEGHSELYSGKHHTTGHVVQVAGDLTGEVRAISDPYPGSWHDAHAYAETEWADYIDDDGGIGDKGYVGTGLATPKKKPPGGELSARDKDCNKEINGLRSVVERAISHVKSWRIFHTDYRRPLRTFDQAFRTTRALYFFSTTF